MMVHMNLCLYAEGFTKAPPHTPLQPTSKVYGRKTFEKDFLEILMIEWQLNISLGTLLSAGIKTNLNKNNFQASVGAN